ncbi:hypothetical protein BXT84_00890 [Sulfobacillus thermotolerans]|uniref:IrrE N-terminal-like domain-containing protein n=1 Tax=Sulfobacillus thermotolerans TaxID=338644 RepID=A0ABN5GWH6_9FIRM|nr:hypothetical protein BXT84_00890 [Sulfobacillus thermotolerans]
MVAIPDGYMNDLLNIRREVHDTADAMMADVPRTLHSVPRPMIAIAEALHYEVVSIIVTDVNNFHGCSNGSRIYIDISHQPWERRFTIGHELGHRCLWVGHKEWECNAYAEAVLLPRNDVRQVLGEWVGHPLSLKAWAVREHEEGLVTRLTKRYGVGYNALISALGNYGYIVDVPPWSARLNGDRVFEEYFQYFRALKANASRRGPL